MNNDKVNMILFSLKENVSSEHIPLLKAKLASANDSAQDNIAYIKFTNPLLVLLLGFFFGHLGADKFMTKNTGAGILRIAILLIYIIFTVIGVITLQLAFSTIGLFAFFVNWIWIISNLVTCYKRVCNMNYIKAVKAIDDAGVDNNQAYNNNTYTTATNYSSDPFVAASAVAPTADQSDYIPQGDVLPPDDGFGWTKDDIEQV